MSRSASLAALVAALLAVASGATASPSAPPSGAELAALSAPPRTTSLARDRIYFVMTDRYANGDPSNDRGGVTGPRQETGYDPISTAWWHGGDFKGLTGTCTDPVHGLARIRDLGFNAIWVTPAVVNQVTQGDSGGYHGYWGIDFTRVDPHLGSDADFASFVECAHSLGLKVILDVVVNHTGDVVQLQNGSVYSSAPYRDCHGKLFDPAAYVGRSTFPCLAARLMPRTPFYLPGQAKLKQPDWLNDPLNYHDRGNIDFSSCSDQCLEQGDFFGLDDLFTEKPNVERGLAQIYGDWIAKYKLDGFRVDTARHVNRGFFQLWVPQILAAAKAAGVPDFQIFGEVFIADSIEESRYARDWGLPSLLDFPFQDAAVGYASGGSTALAVANRLQDDDYSRRADGVDPTPPTFLGNHDMGRAALQISQAGGGVPTDLLLPRTLLGYDLMYLLRGAPVVYYGDEVGMIGTGGDQQARQDMFPTQVAEWQTQARLGGPPIGTGSSFDVRDNPIELRLKQLAALREHYPVLATGATIVRVAQRGLLAISRIDATSRREYLELFNSGTASVRATVRTSTPLSEWGALLGSGEPTSDQTGTLSVPVPALSSLVFEANAPLPVRALPAIGLRAAPDSLSSLFTLTATAPTQDPLSVTFAIRRRGGPWRRVDVDDSPPYRGFLEPGSFRKGERIEAVAIARSSDGKVRVSQVMTATPRPQIASAT